MPATPPAPEAAARPAPAPHWRNWRNGGAALSALLHVIVVAALTASVPVLGGPSEREAAIPVEIVDRTPPKVEPEKPAETKAPEAPKPEFAKPEPAAPEPPKSEPPKPEQKSLPTPAAAPPPAPTTMPPAPMPRAALPEPPPPPPPETHLPAPAPAAPLPQGPEGGRKVEADEVAPPGDRKGFGYWVLEPLVANLRHRCGVARISGVLELSERVGEGHYRGVMRTRIAWSHCAPEGVVHEVELRIDGSEVRMIGASGFVDRGVIRENTMMLEDAYGRSVWKKR